MTITRCADVHQVYIVAVEHPPPVRVVVRPTQLMRRGLHRWAIPASHDGHLWAQRQVKEPWRHPPPLGVRGDHEGIPDHSDAQSSPLMLSHHLRPYRQYLPNTTSSVQ